MLLLCSGSGRIFDLLCLSGVPAKRMALDPGNVFCGELGNYVELGEYIGIFLPSGRAFPLEKLEGMRSIS